MSSLDFLLCTSTFHESVKHSFICFSSQELSFLLFVSSISCWHGFLPLLCLLCLLIILSVSRIFNLSLFPKSFFLPWQKYLKPRKQTSQQHPPSILISVQLWPNSFLSFLAKLLKRTLYSHCLDSSTHTTGATWPSSTETIFSEVTTNQNHCVA